MEFRIADTFTDSLARLTGEEQRAVKTTAFDLQLNPAHPGLQFHKLDKAKDKQFWSVRVSSDIRLIVHRTEQSLLLCYGDHHDGAYEWAEKRKLETHPTNTERHLLYASGPFGSVCITELSLWNTKTISCGSGWGGTHYTTGCLVPDEPPGPAQIEISCRAQR